MLNEPLMLWARLLFRLGLVLSALGLLPLLAVQFLFTEVNPLVPILLSLSVAPLGIVALAAALIVFLAALLRRRGPS